MGREEMPLPVAIEVPAPCEPVSEERRHHGLTPLPYNLGASLSSDMKHDHKCNQAHQSSNATIAP